MYCPLESYDNEMDDWFAFAWMLQACAWRAEVAEQVKTVCSDDLQHELKYWSNGSHRSLMGSQDSCPRWEERGFAHSWSSRQANYLEWAQLGITASYFC